jgi:transcriptional regulator with XRE-family HTH domain
MRDAFAKALRTARKAHGLTQEDFSPTSSRTYVSILERGRKSPTLDKLDDIAQTIGINLLTLMTLTKLYHDSNADLESLLDRVRNEVNDIRRSADQDT